MTNTRKTLLTSVAAAALIAGVGVVSAQAPPAPAPAPAAQQNAPAEKMGPALRETGQASPDQKRSEPKADMKKDKDAQAPAPATKSTTGQGPAQDDKKSK